jgi:hypothetical protein
MSKNIGKAPKKEQETGDIVVVSGYPYFVWGEAVFTKHNSSRGRIVVTPKSQHFSRFDFLF